jgi:serine/threonine protein kinase/tetratricopeptide (TPR) repeat protein
VQPGTLLGERFELEMLAASGGMGHVYRAIDRKTAQRVAIKILARGGEIDSERFARETEIIATLRHPRIVQYLTHGGGPEQPWLAMEWLEGVPLATLLARGPLAIEQSIGVIRNAAEGLTMLHARGLVHRDIKPSNLFLVGGDIERLKLLDFGIARANSGSTLTRSGALVGTPGYVAPEQARGGQPLDARADVFALGCVLFECLTGRPAFAGEHLLAALAKILLEDPPRAGDLCSGVPPDLEELLWRMMSKSPADRPRDAQAVLAELAALAPLDERARAAPAALTSREQRLLSIIVATGEGVPSAGGVAKAGATAVAGKGSNGQSDTLHSVRQIASHHDGRIVTLASGSLLVVLRSSGAATDLAARAARCALELRELLPLAALGIATGRGLLSGTALTGEVIDRGVHLVRADGKAGVRVDEVTAGLVGGRFDVKPEGGQLMLWGELDADDPPPALLGRPSPFVGRDDDLLVLTRAFDATAADKTARAVLVLGAPGIGKSRLAREFCAMLAKRDPAPAIWKARGDPMRANSPFGFLAPAIRRLCSIHEGDALEVQRQKLAARVPAGIPEADRRRVCEFVGELSAIRFDDDDSPQLRAARRDPMLMSEQIRLAWEDWVAAESAAGPLVLVLEDLHWADMASMKLVQALLRRRSDRNVFVLALARPEMTPWQEGGVQQLHLGELSEMASKSLVHIVLGAQASDEVARRLAAQAAGNALLLEELIVATAEGKGALPDTVLAVLAARLERLDPEPRRLLRAASVFGATFWTGGLARLSGNTDANVREWLTWLVDRELLHQRTMSRFDGQSELVFHHALLRDAAYALLTEADRVTGHRLAAEWLEQAGESDPAILADHFERGGEPRRAIEHHLRSAQRSLDGNDLDAAVAHAERGIACGAEGETLGRLHLIAATVRNWQGKADLAHAAATAALARLPQRGTVYYAALQEVVDASTRLNRHDSTLEVFAILRDTEPGEDSRDYLIGCARTLFALLVLGRSAEANCLMDKLKARGAEGNSDPSVRAHFLIARAVIAHYYLGDPSAASRDMREAAMIFEQAGMLRETCIWNQDAAFMALEAGAPPEEAEQMLRDGLNSARALNIGAAVAGSLNNLSLALVRGGRFEEARRAAVDALSVYLDQADTRMESATRVYLASALIALGDLAAAEREIRAAIEGLAGLPTLTPNALAVLAQILLRTGRVDEAVVMAGRGFDMMATLPSVEEGESTVRLTWAEALEASGQRDRARAAFEQAERRLLDRADRISDRDWRRRFLEAVPENARTLVAAARYRRNDPADKR